MPAWLDRILPNLSEEVNDQPTPNPSDPVAVA